jgi:hypothetical protein
MSLVLECEEKRSEKRANLLLNPLLEGLHLFENFIARCLVARLLGAQVVQLSTEGISLLVS